MSYSFTEILVFFMFYAVIGWCTEVIYATTNSGKFVNRGFLNGPLCPIYGVGATIVILCLTPIQDNLLVLYVGSVLLTSAIEFLTGFVLEKIFHQKWWDYTDEHFNLMGYVCLKFSLLWGLGCVFVMKVIQPIVLKVIHSVNPSLQKGILIAFYTLLAADLAITIAELAKISRQLRIANDIDRLCNRLSEMIGTRLSDGTVKGMKEYHEQKDKLDRRYDRLVEKAKSKYGEQYHEVMQKAEERLSFVHKRLEKAYPALNLKRIGNIGNAMNSLKAQIEKHLPNQPKSE